VSVVIFPMHIRKETKIHTMKSKAEKMPVLTLKASVGSKSSFSVSVVRDFFGIARMIRKVMTGKAIPRATIRLGVDEQSLKKQTINPIIPRIHTAMVPWPTPKTRPS
jgi:hypothetical protein